MKSKALISIVSLFVALVLLAGTCSAGFVAGRMTVPETATDVLPTQSTPVTDSTQELFVPFWEAWKLVHDEYVDQPVDDEALMQGAIRGMLDSLGDQHTSYMTPQDYEDATTALSGEYEGIGAWVNTDAEYLTISQPMPGSPAEKAGLRPGDQVIAIDGVDMTGVDPEIARQHVLGPKGTPVRLTIQRGEMEPFDVTITRATIRVPSVDSKMLEGQIAYVQLFTFGSNTTEELQNALKDLMKQQPVGLILDLRNNGGGELGTAINVASQFIGDGAVMYEEYGDGKRITYSAEPGGLATKIPLVVLVNEWSASASEIVAGAIQDRGRGQLVGVTTFGKGSVQIWFPLSHEQGAARITIARWLTPHGRQIHEAGLKPDFEVSLSEEDAAAGRDPQLDKAVELLAKK